MPDDVSERERETTKSERRRERERERGAEVQNDVTFMVWNDGVTLIIERRNNIERERVERRRN